MHHLVYEIPASPEKQEILCALLAALPFEGFEEGEHALRAYLPRKAWSEEIEDRVLESCQKLGLSYQRSKLEDRNWNALWESNFTPISLPGYCYIRADFHPEPPAGAYEHSLLINPKMAFGTGHHATTRMVLLELQKHVLSGKRVLDYGCGTGILGIVAAQRGAGEVTGIDIDPASTENSRENAQANACSLELHTGDLNVLPPGKHYDLILANINRNVILNALPTLYRLLEKDGILIISGFLAADLEGLRKTLAQEGWLELHQRQEGDWICLSLTRN